MMKKKKGTGIKVLTLNKLLNRIPVLLAETNARIGSRKLKNEIRQIAYLLFQHNKMRVINKDNKLVITKEPKPSHSDLPKMLTVL